MEVPGYVAVIPRPIFGGCSISYNRCNCTFERRTSGKTVGPVFTDKHHSFFLLPGVVCFTWQNLSHVDSARPSKE